jgi:hypothetical protein
MIRQDKSPLNPPKGDFINHIIHFFYGTGVRTTIIFRCACPYRRVGIMLFIVLFTTQQNAGAQQSKPVTLMDFVKIKDGKKAETIYFYENNWKLYRDIALKRNIIQSYQLVEVASDTLNNFDLILITTYKDSAQFLKSEENFAPILKEARPNGPALLNGLKPADFRQNVFFKVTQPVFSSGKRKNNE